MDEDKKTEAQEGQQEEKKEIKVTISPDFYIGTHNNRIIAVPYENQNIEDYYNDVQDNIVYGIFGVGYKDEEITSVNVEPETGYYASLESLKFDMNALYGALDRPMLAQGDLGDDIMKVKSI